MEKILKEKGRDVEQLTTTLICPAVYKKLFDADYSLEEIAAYCCTSVSTIIQYISDEDIDRIARRKLKKKGSKLIHPMEHFFVE